MDRDPQDWQEAHSPTVATKIVISHTPRRETAGPRRRAADDRLWSSFSDDEIRAAEELCRVWHYLAVGLTPKAQSFERRDPSREDGRDISLRLVDVHRSWRLRVAAIERSVCQAVLFEGMGVRDAARAYRKASAWPRWAIGNCLEKWIELSGWG